MSRWLPPVLLFAVCQCGVASADQPCCQGCGCRPCTKKVCRLVCETKEVTKKVYSCKCEDFCIPGRSICCKKPCDCHGLCGLFCDHYTYKPTCGCVRTRVVPVITNETKTVPSYKCVVEEVCTRCGHCANRLDYPTADDPKAAVAMVKDPKVELPACPDSVAEPYQANHVVAAGFIERPGVPK
ncbi:MAG: hypothetical protein HYX69_07715 [Planctomycetia bacterium]|nr:hypothetical protein [Planctomycetia bacterium]